VRRLIVNADDFGWSPDVNAGIVDGHLNGIITSTTLLVNAPAFDDAVEQAKATPSLGVGLHLNFTQGRPVADPGSVSSMVDANGDFRGARELIMGLIRGHIPAAELQCEILAQLQTFREHLGEPTHLDSHKHVHVWGCFPRALASVAVELATPRVRCPLEGLSTAWLRSPAVFTRAALLRCLSGRAGNILSRAGYRKPDHFRGVADTGFLSPAGVEAMLQRLPSGTTELMCHPGLLPTGTPFPTFKTRLVESRHAELKTIKDATLTATVESASIDLVSYAEL
jgi:predicted glycoside hydrolase/deacetylase ChbG (UPF0249 family)